MGKHHLVKDPRIMKPLEEFLRTVREVVQLPPLKEHKVEGHSPYFLARGKKIRRFKRWW